MAIKIKVKTKLSQSECADCKHQYQCYCWRDWQEDIKISIEKCPLFQEKTIAK